MTDDSVYANSVDAQLVERFDRWYEGITDALAPFEVLESWVRARGGGTWSFAWGRVETPWGAVLTEGDELAQLIGEPGTRANTWSRQLDRIEYGPDEERARQARNERAWSFALHFSLGASPAKRSGRHPHALAEALYARSLVDAGMGQRQAARHVLEREGIAPADWYGVTAQQMAGSRLAQYRRVWRKLGMLPTAQAA